MSSSNVTRSKYVNIALESLGRYSELVVKYFDGDDQQKLVDEILEYGEQYSILDVRNRNSAQCLAEIQDALREQSNRRRNNEEQEEGEADIEEINVRDMYKTKMQEKCAKKVDPKKQDIYKTLKNRIDHLTAQGTSDQNGEGSMIVDAEVNIYDPITKKEMTDPVRIKECGHSFERNSIMCLLKSSKNGIKCPVPGCILQTRISVSNLEDNHELRLMLQERARTSS